MRLPSAIAVGALVAGTFVLGRMLASRNVGIVAALIVPEDALLRGPRGGVLTTATVRDATHWDGIVLALGLPDLRRHGLRHTGATWLADSGIPLHVLQQILGHQSIETTRLYLHPDTRHLAEAAKRANAFLSLGTNGGTTKTAREL